MDALTRLGLGDGVQWAATRVRLHLPRHLVLNGALPPGDLDAIGLAHRDVVSGPFTDPEMAGAVSDPSGTCAAIAWQRERETNARAI